MYQSKNTPLVGAYKAPAPKPVELTPELIAFQQKFLAETQDRKFAPVAEYEKEVTIVSAGNGIFRVRKTPVALFIQKISDAKIPGVPDMKEEAILLVPKIPMKYIVQILTFYRDVHAKDKTEACANFYWNHNNVPVPNYDGVVQDGQLIVFCPFQRNSSAETNFESGVNTRGEEIAWFRQNMSPLLETHSHHTMDAFWSGTDDSNENYPQFYLVLGKITSDQIRFEFRWCEGDKKMNKLSPSLLIDWPQITQVQEKFETTKTTITVSSLEGSFLPESIVSDLDQNASYSQEAIGEVKTETLTKDYDGPFERAEYPSEWLEKQHHPSFVAYNYGGFYGGTAAGKKSVGTPGIGMTPNGTTGRNLGYPNVGTNPRGIKTVNGVEELNDVQQVDLFEDSIGGNYAYQGSYEDFGEIGIYENYNQLPYKEQLDVDNIVKEMANGPLSTLVSCMDIEFNLGVDYDQTLTKEQEEEMKAIEDDAQLFSENLVEAITKNPNKEALRTILTTMYN